MDYKAFGDIKIISYNIKEGTTLREYMQLLLTTLFEEGEGFSGKRPLGNSGWDYEVGKSIALAGFIDCDIDNFGSEDPLEWDVDYDNDEAQKLIFSYINQLS